MVSVIAVAKPVFTHSFSHSRNLYDVGSVCEGLCKHIDLRQAKGKQYALEMALLIAIMAKLCGEDKPLGLAEWVQHRRKELVQLLGLN